MAIEKSKKMSNEMKEKKEDFLGKIEKPKASGQGFPLHLIVMLVALGILIGVAAMMVSQPKPQPIPIDQNTPQINDIGYRSVPLTIVYSSECAGCRQTNSIEDLFKARQISYSMTKIDANSEEGRKMVARFGIDRVPAAIVDADMLSFYPSTKTQFEEAARIGYLGFKKANSAFVIPEYSNEEIFYPSYFIDKVGGYCADGRPTIVQFDDFYNPIFTKNRGQMYNFTDDFNSEAKIMFSYTQTQYSSDTNSALGNIFLMCASEQGKYLEMERAMAGIYCNNPFKGDPTMLTEPEINGCWTLSEHYGTPLSQFELDVAAMRAGLDSNKLKECYDKRQAYYKISANAVKELGLERTGVFLLDCRETTTIDLLKETFCARNPSLKACAEKPAQDTNGQS